MKKNLPTASAERPILYTFMAVSKTVICDILKLYVCVCVCVSRTDSCTRPPNVMHLNSADTFVGTADYIHSTAWQVLRLRMEERPPIWRVDANILNKQSRTANKGWSSNLGVGRGAKNFSS